MHGLGIDHPAVRKAVQASLALTSVMLLFLSGCTSFHDYVRNGYKVGPQYTRPPAPVAPTWIDATDTRVRSEEADISSWWGVFNDPQLNDLVQTAYRQNLTLKEAGFRVLESRAELGISIGMLFPQTQVMNGSADSHGVSTNVANRVATPTQWFGQWNYGFNIGWELDFWGRFRRAIEAREDTLNSSVENYDDVIVTLIGDVANTYVQIRILQQQIAYAKQMLGLQREGLEIAVAKFKGGQVSKIDPDQGQSDVATTEALIEQLQIPLRQATNRLCILMGMPPEDLIKMLGDKPIPTAPPEAAIGIPGDLLRRRPDIRKAERLAAAQSAMIGVATADFYPQISLNASLGWSAQQLKDLFASHSFREVAGPGFNWPILNYGRILNNVRAQDAKFQELVVNYQSTVLKAAEEVENGLVTFLRAQTRTRAAKASADAEMSAFKEAVAQYKGGLVDYNRVVLIQERLVERLQTLAESQGQIAQGLIQVYRALGGGWQIRCGPGEQVPPGPAPVVEPIDETPKGDPKDPAPIPIAPAKPELKVDALPSVAVPKVEAKPAIKQLSSEAPAADGELRWEKVNVQPQAK